MDDATTNDGDNASPTAPSPTVPVDTASEPVFTAPSSGFRSMIENKIDGFGNKILKVFASGPHFLIYQIDTTDIGDSLRVFIESTPAALPLIEAFAKMNREFSDAVSLLHTTDSPDLVRADIARAIAASFVSTNVDGAEELRQIQARVGDQNHYIKGARFLYAYAAFTYLIFIAAEYYFRVIVTGQLKEASLITDVFDVLLATALGGSLSILTGLSKIDFDIPMFSTRPHRLWQMICPIFVVFERIVVATVAGAIAYVLIKSNLVLQPITDGNRWSVMVILILAGFSESLVPSALTRIEKQASAKSGADGR